MTKTIIRKPYIVSEENFAELSQLFKNALRIESNGGGPTHNPK